MLSREFSSICFLCLFSLAASLFIDGKNMLNPVFSNCFPAKNTPYRIPVKHEDMYTFILEAKPMTHAQAMDNCRKKGAELNARDQDWNLLALKTFVDKNCPKLGLKQYVWAFETNTHPMYILYDFFAQNLRINSPNSTLPSVCRFDRPCLSPNNKTAALRFQTNHSLGHQSYSIYSHLKKSYSEAVSFCRRNGGDIAVHTPKFRQALAVFLNTNCANRTVPEFLWIERDLCPLHSFATDSMDVVNCRDKNRFVCFLPNPLNVTGRTDASSLSTCMERGQRFVFVKKEMNLENAMSYCRELGGHVPYISHAPGNHNAMFWSLDPTRCPAIMNGFVGSWLTWPECFVVEDPKSTNGHEHPDCSEKYAFVCEE